MPRNVRNFWIEGNIDGQKTPVAFGPRNKDGGFIMSIKMRDNGGILSSVHIEGKADVEGKLHLFIDGYPVEQGTDWHHTIETRR